MSIVATLNSVDGISSSVDEAKLVKGDKGDRGSIWKTGTALTGTDTVVGSVAGTVDDMYLNTETGYVYKCTTASPSAATWTYECDLSGEADAALAAQIAAEASAEAAAADKATVATDKATVAADKAIVAEDKETVSGYKASVEADKNTVAADKETVLSAKTAVETATDTVAADKAIVEADKASVSADKAIVATDKATVELDKQTVADDKAAVLTAKETVLTAKSVVEADKAAVAADKETVAGYKTAVETDKADVASDKASVEATVAEFNANASNKTSAFNSNATSKTNAFDSNATSKTNTFNSNAATKQATVDSSANAAATSASNAATSAANALTSEDNAAQSALEAEQYAEQAASGQVNSDWNATSGKAQILNKPTSVSEFENDSGYLTQHQDISGKVDKVSGKGLSTNDYTAAEKTKLSGIEAGAQVNPSSLPASDVPAWAKSPTKPSYTYSEIEDIPSTFPPDSHTHDDRYYTETEVDTALGGKANTSHTHTKSQITDFPTSMTPTSHTHQQSEVTGLANALAGKQAQITTNGLLKGNGSSVLAAERGTDYSLINTPVTATFTVAGWAQNATTGAYEQSVAVSGLLATDDKRTRVELVGSTDVDAQALIDAAYGMVKYAACNTNGYLYLRCDEGCPETAFTVAVIIGR